MDVGLGEALTRDMAWVDALTRGHGAGQCLENNAFVAVMYRHWCVCQGYSSMLLRLDHDAAWCLCWLVTHLLHSWRCWA